MQRGGSTLLIKAYTNFQADGAILVESFYLILSHDKYFLKILGQGKILEDVV